MYLYGPSHETCITVVLCVVSVILEKLIIKKKILTSRELSATALLVSVSAMFLLEKKKRLRKVSFRQREIVLKNMN